MRRKIYNDKRTIYTPGRVTELLLAIEDGQPLTARDKLRNNDMEQVVRAFSNLRFDVNLLEIENDDEINTANGNTILGNDLKALVLMMYKYSRSTYFMKSPGTDVRGGAYISAAAPLPLVGYRMFKKRNFNDWKLPADAFYFNEDLGLTVKDKYLQQLFHLDLLLGFGLKSTSLDDYGQIVVEPQWGLSIASAYAQLTKDFEITSYGTRALRKLGFGKRKGNIATVYGASDVTLEDYCEELGCEKDDPKFYHQWKVYNESCQVLKHMLTQRWVYYGHHRSPDCVGQLLDWDTHYTALDKPSTSMQGLQPQQTLDLGAKSALDLFGLMNKKTEPDSVDDELKL